MTRVELHQLKEDVFNLMFCFYFPTGIFEDDFIEERRQGLEAFINRCAVI